jgi:uncharacterized protein
MTFINRQDELKDLEKLWNEKKSQLVIFYGKRRVGKTELIKQFIAKKPSIYYLADKRTHHDQLVELGKRIGRFFSDAIVERNGFRNWIDVFEYLKDHAKTPFILAIDEYPYLTDGDSSTGSLFQKGWDEYLKGSPVFLILCGSSISMMEQETLSHTAPLYGRRTAEFLIEPMMYHNSREFYPEHFSFTKFIEFYTLSGGMPAYLSQFAAYSNRKKAVEALVFKRNGPLSREIEFLLKEETRESKTYLSILSAIALGSHKFGEIIGKTGLEKNVLNKYLSVLSRLFFIKRETPITEKNPEKSKKSLYFLSDLFFRFWFQYVFPNKSELEIGSIEGVLDDMDNTIVHLESYTYEEVCKQWLQINKIDSFTPQKIGRWWSSTDEIDVVATNKRDNQIVFGEVKWTKEKVGLNILESLKEKSLQVDWGKPNRKEIFILFSKNGFTNALIEHAKQEGVLLVEGDMLLI